MFTTAFSGGDVNAGGGKKQRHWMVWVCVCCSSRLNRAIIYNQSTFKYIYETLFTFSMRITNLCEHIWIYLWSTNDRCIYQWMVFVNQFVGNSLLFIAKRKQITHSQSYQAKGIFQFLSIEIIYKNTKVNDNQFVYKNDICVCVNHTSNFIFVKSNTLMYWWNYSYWVEIFFCFLLKT